MGDGGERGAVSRARGVRGVVRRAGGAALVLAREADPRPRAEPDFVILGAQKAGTSSLYAQLGAHPSVLPALKKEVHYFDRPPRSARWYRAHFPLRSRLAAVGRRTGVARTGEATPYYLFHPAAPGRMHAHLPDARLVVVLRDPVARAISAYHHAVAGGDEQRPIDVALDPANEEPLAPPNAAGWYDAPDCPARLRGYLARGRYAEQLERWFAVYPREQVLVLETGELRAGSAPPAVLEFLGLPPVTAPSVPDRNVGRYTPPASDLEARLREHFAPHNARLVSLLGVDWRWPT